MENRKKFAVYIITKHGLEIGKRIKESIEDCDLYVSKRFIDIAPGASKLLHTPMKPTLKETWKEYDCHIHIISLGATVRMIAPLMENKKIDPSVICIDDASKFSICLLSGHVGRGNEFTLKISKVLENIPVITTASDVRNTLTVDILGRELGWVLDDLDRNVTRGCAAVVNQLKVGFIQATGEANFWRVDQTLPKGVEYYTSLDDINPENYEILLICSDQLIKRTHPKHYENSVIYRPKSLVLGLGCDKNTPIEVVEEGIKKHLREAGLDIKCVKSIATIDLKANEKAFVEICDKYKWDFITYRAELLDKVVGIENPSDTVKKYVGTRSVGEAASLLAAKTNKLLVSKKKFNLKKDGFNMTFSAARLNFEKRCL